MCARKAWRRVEGEAPVVEASASMGRGLFAAAVGATPARLDRSDALTAQHSTAGPSTLSGSPVETGAGPGTLAPRTLPQRARRADAPASSWPGQPPVAPRWPARRPPPPPPPPAPLRSLSRCWRRARWSACSNLRGRGGEGVWVGGKGIWMGRARCMELIPALVVLPRRAAGVSSKASRVQVGRPARHGSPRAPPAHQTLWPASPTSATRPLASLLQRVLRPPREGGTDASWSAIICALSAGMEG